MIDGRFLLYKIHTVLSEVVQMILADRTLDPYECHHLIMFQCHLEVMATMN